MAKKAVRPEGSKGSSRPHGTLRARRRQTSGESTAHSPTPTVPDAASGAAQRLTEALVEFRRESAERAASTRTVLALGQALREALRDEVGASVPEQIQLEAAYAFGGALRVRSRFFDTFLELPRRPVSGTVVGVDRRCRRSISVAVRRGARLLDRLDRLQRKASPWTRAFDGGARSTVRNAALLYGADRLGFQRAPRLWPGVAAAMVDLLLVDRAHCERRPFGRQAPSVSGAMAYLEAAFRDEVATVAEFRDLRVSEHPGEAPMIRLDGGQSAFEGWRRWVERRRSWWMEIARSNTPSGSIPPAEAERVALATDAAPTNRVRVRRDHSTFLIQHPDRPESMVRSVATEQLFVLVANANRVHSAEEVIDGVAKERPRNVRSISGEESHVATAQAAKLGERVVGREDLASIRERLAELVADRENAEVEGNPLSIAEIDNETAKLNDAMKKSLNRRGRPKLLDQAGANRHACVRKNLKNALKAASREAPRFHSLVEGRLDVRAGQLRFTPMNGDPPIDVAY